MEIMTAVALREYLSREWALIVAGALSLVFGIILFVRPGIGLLSILWLIGVYALIFGVSSSSVLSNFAPGQHP